MTTRTAVRRLAAAALVLLLAGCTSAESEPLTVKVTRTSVTSTVTATGSLQAITEQNVGFPEGGKLVEVNVAVGQQVEPGQILARLDDFSARQDLAAAEAQLAQEQAVLARIRGGNQVNAAEDDVERAGAVLKATKERAEAVDDANASAVEEAERQLELDKEVLHDTKARTRGHRRSCTAADRRAAERDDGRDEPLIPLSGRGRQAEDCDVAAEKEAEVEQAERQVRASEAALERAENQRRVDRAEQDLAIENARRELEAAKNEAEGARGDRPHDIDEQAAVVAQLQAEVDLARRTVEDTILRSPVAGKVASINGVVGEFLGGGSGTTPLAPGGTVPLPERGSAVSSSEQAGNENERPGGSAFIVLGDVQSFRIVAPFAETDAALVQPNQAVEATFDAIPDLTRSGRVASIAPTATDIRGVTSYYAVIVLNELDPRLRDGLTASANVVVDHRDDTLAIPNGALMQSGGSGIVTVLEPDGAQRQVQVELGLAGDSVTQVVGGLREGQQVLVAPGG
ncbi:HlyD family secretion protein [Pseudonocardia hierapolitana]|uniref:HlyD family secretion protein n=1 Tax=Pseudonocardia hierapolitana TaxID=1128676 RepID=A0A561SI05_9PSEU|nr:biotin/lipoyl-binding protein [Pseudonocardia hierapolitana]TWF74519.1 HlyD family secretion protein [Pseudonocardia hierapolitana]